MNESQPPGLDDHPRRVLWVGRLQDPFLLKGVSDGHECERHLVVPLECDAMPESPAWDGCFIYDGNPIESTAWMVGSDGFWETFDVIGICNSLVASDLLALACNCWALLKSEGRMIFQHSPDDDDHIRLDRPEHGVEAFLSAFADKIRVEIGDDTTSVFKVPVLAATAQVSTFGCIPRFPGKRARMADVHRELAGTGGITGVILNWKRPDNLFKILDGWQASPLIRSAIVWNNNPMMEIRHPWATVINANDDLGLYSRIAAACLVPTEGVLLQDDDLLISPDELEVLHHHWLADPEVIHGLFGRRFDADSDHAVRVDLCEDTAPVVLTRMMLLRRRILPEFFKLAGLFHEEQAHSRPYGNGEDIILSYAAMGLSARENRIHRIWVRELDSSHAISLRHGNASHEAHRSRILKGCELWLSSRMAACK